MSLKNDSELKVQVMDSFCGFGGVTEGIEMARDLLKQFEIIAAINHDPKAIQCYDANHKGGKTFVEDFKELILSKLPSFLQEAIRCFWASLECTNFSIAKGGLSRDADSRTLAEHMYRYIDYLISVGQKLHYIYIENVREFLDYGPLVVRVKTTSEGYEYCPLQYNKKQKTLKPVWVPDPEKKGEYFANWVKEIESRGYRMEYRIINSADFGAYTNRKRLFIIFASEGMPIAWPKPTHAKKPKKGSGLKRYRAMKPCLDLTDKGQNIFCRVNKKGLHDPLCENSLRRIYTGLKVHIPKDKAFIHKYMSNSPKTGTNSGSSINNPSPVVTTQVRMALVSTESVTHKEFLTQYNSGSDKNRVNSVNTPCNTIPTNNRFALVQPQFMIKYFGNGQNVADVNKPAPTITTKDRLAKIEAEFMINYHHSSTNSSLDNPNPTITTKDKFGLIHAEHLIDQQYGQSEPHPIDQSAGALTANPKLNLITTERFLNLEYSNGKQSQGIKEPSGSILPQPKQKLVTVEQVNRDGFLVNTNFNNKPTSLNEPSPVITADRHHHYLINPQWGWQPGSINNPAFTLIARMDKAPPYLVTLETGDLAIEIYETDSFYTKKIKEFMAAYGIIAIYMRMLRVDELLKIQGFPRNYFNNIKNISKTDQKKFIGNSVVPLVAQKLFEALYIALLGYFELKKAA